MSTQRVSSAKIPMFDRENYGLWKKKMMLFQQVANPKYLGVLKNGPKIPMVLEPERIENGVVVAVARSYPKDPTLYTIVEIEDASLDINLQLILVESLVPIMYNHVVNCKDAKHIWDTIKTIKEGTEEVRENRMEILTSEYEHFKSTSEDGISEVFERYNKLINKLNLHRKFYTQKEINKKFLLTLPTHLEHRITTIRELRDMHYTRFRIRQCLFNNGRRKNHCPKKTNNGLFLALKKHRAISIYTSVLSLNKKQLS